MAQHLAVRIRPTPFPEPPTVMNPLMQQMQNWLGPNANAIRALAAPLVVVMILAMMVLPLPPFALDLLFTFNIAMALMVMIDRRAHV